MPYSTNEDLPISVRGHLPTHAQDIYREAVNHAWSQYANSGKAVVGSAAHPARLNFIPAPAGLFVSRVGHGKRR